jgi:hypothetical protein
MTDLSPTLYVIRASYARSSFARQSTQDTAGFRMIGDAHGAR